jgi:hypothetical protein
VSHPSRAGSVIPGVRLRFPVPLLVIGLFTTCRATFKSLDFQMQSEKDLANALELGELLLRITQTFLLTPCETREGRPPISMEDRFC